LRRGCDLADKKGVKTSTDIYLQGKCKRSCRIYKWNWT